MKESINIIRYSDIKLIQSCLFNDQMLNNLLSGHYDIDVFSIQFIYVLSVYVEDITSEGIYEQKQISSLYEIIHYIRYKTVYANSEHKRIIFEICNEMIQKLNIYQEKNSFGFYISEINKRYNIRLFDNNNYPLYYKLVKESLGLDYVILNTHLRRESDDNFAEIKDFFKLDMQYFATWNAMIEEFPGIMADMVVLKRLKEIILLNEKSKKELKGYENFEKKFILEQNKVYSKCIKGV